jgi:hypothetical protein
MTEIINNEQLQVLSKELAELEQLEETIELISNNEQYNGTIK